MAKKRVQVSFTPEQFEKLENEAKNKGLSKTAIVILALEKYFGKENEK